MTPRTSIKFSGTANGVGVQGSTQPNPDGGTGTSLHASPPPRPERACRYDQVPLLFTDPRARGHVQHLQRPFQHHGGRGLVRGVLFRVRPLEPRGVEYRKGERSIRPRPRGRPHRPASPGGTAGSMLSLDRRTQPTDARSGIARIDILRQFNGSATVAPGPPAPTFLKIGTRARHRDSGLQVSQAEYPWYYAVVTDKAGNASGLIQLNSTSALSVSPLNRQTLAGALGLADYQQDRQRAERPIQRPGTASQNLLHRWRRSDDHD